MSDEWNENLNKDIYEQNRSTYVKWVLEALEDPDYDGVPLIVDPASGSLWGPTSMSRKAWLRALNWAKQMVKENVARDTEPFNPDVH